MWISSIRKNSTATMTDTTKLMLSPNTLALESNIKTQAVLWQANCILNFADTELASVFRSANSSVICKCRKEHQVIPPKHQAVRKV